jgi:hypothetical protein
MHISVPVKILAGDALWLSLVARIVSAEGPDGASGSTLARRMPRWPCDNAFQRPRWRTENGSLHRVVLDAAAGAAEEDRQLVADKPASEVAKDVWTAGELCSVYRLPSAGNYLTWRHLGSMMRQIATQSERTGRPE